MLDVAAVNAFVIFMTKFPMFYGNKSYRWRLLLKDLGMKLVCPNIECKASENFSGMQKNIQRCIQTKEEDRCGLCLLCGERAYSMKCVITVKHFFVPNTVSLQEDFLSYALSSFLEGMNKGRKMSLELQ
ncbi:hypothetical protein T09_7680 [Trichinella sp. T9]|nr:hypothetical protein T09_7680 [Trichinella sp. T9]